MKSKYLKATVLATAVVVAGALVSPVTANTLQFTFGTPSGGAHCDGLTLTQDKAPPANVRYGGTHTGCSNNDPAGGYVSRINGGQNVTISTTNTTFSADSQTFFLYLPGNEWYLYTTNGGVFEQIDSGPLIAGPPSARGKVHATPAGSPNPKGKLDRMF